MGILSFDYSFARVVDMLSYEYIFVNGFAWKIKNAAIAAKIR